MTHLGDGRRGLWLSGELIYHRLQAFDAEGAEYSLRLAGFSVDEHPGRLADDVVEGPYLLVDVCDVVDVVQLVAHDEVVHGVHSVSACDAEDGDAIWCLPRNLRDPGSFPVTRRSPWRPEPQDNIATGEVAATDLASVDEVGAEVEGVGDGGRLGIPSGHGGRGACVRRLSCGRAGRDRHGDREQPPSHQVNPDC